MEDVFFGVSDGVSESCFSSTLDDFLPDWEHSWFSLGDEKQVTCNNSPSHESDSGLSSVISDIGSPLPDENNMAECGDCHSGLNVDFQKAKDLLDTDSDLLSFLMSSDDESTCETSGDQEMPSTEPEFNLDVNMNVDDNENRVGYNLRKKTVCSSGATPVVVNEPIAQVSSLAPKKSDTIVSTPVTTKTTSVKLVRLVTPVVPGKAVTSDDVVKAIEVKNKKNAQNAKMNREKKKSYIKGLEEEVDNLKTENCSLKKEAKTLKSQKADLQEEVAYLKSVLANESSLSALLKNIPSVKSVQLSSSFVSKKRSAEEDHDYVSAAKKRRKGGVCLHVEGDSVSLEFCSRCAEMASNSGVDK